MHNTQKLKLLTLLLQLCKSVFPFSDTGEIFEACFRDQRCELSEELCVSTVHEIIARAPQHSGSDICSRISWLIRLQTWCLCTCFRIGKVNYCILRICFTEIVYIQWLTPSLPTTGQYSEPVHSASHSLKCTFMLPSKVGLPHGQF